MGNYTLDQAQRDIADLRGQIAHGLAFSEFLSLATGSIAIDDAGGDTYNAGQLVRQTSGTTISSTSPVTITGLSFDVAAGESYLVRGKIKFTAAGIGTAQGVTARFSGTAAMSSMLICVWGLGEGAGQSGNFGSIISLGSDPSAVVGSIANGRVFYNDFEGVINVSAAGTFQVQARVLTNSSDENFAIAAGSFAELVRI